MFPNVVQESLQRVFNSQGMCLDVLADHFTVNSQTEEKIRSVVESARFYPFVSKKNKKFAFTVVPYDIPGFFPIVEPETKECKVFRFQHYFEKTMRQLPEALNIACEKRGLLNFSREQATDGYCFIIQKCFQLIEESLPEEIITPFSRDRNTVTIQEFQEYCRTTLEKAFEILARREGVTVLSHNVRADLSDHERRCFNLRWSRIFDCTNYALYKLQDLRFVQRYRETGGREFSSKLALMGLMEELHYHPVSDPQAKDFIVYLASDVPIHVGVLADSRTVHSKWGKDVPQALAHPIAYSPYGNSVLFFRKNS